MANTSKSSSKLRILYAEGDSEVLASQSVTIEKAGYNVTQAEGRKQVQDILRQKKFDLVILGPTLTKNDRRSSRSRRHPGNRQKHERPAGKDCLASAHGGRSSLRTIAR